LEDDYNKVVIFVLLSKDVTKTLNDVSIN